MPTNFPSGIDSFVDPNATDPLSNPPHHTQHGNANDALVAIETKVGINGSADTNSLDYKITHITGVVSSFNTRTGAVTLASGDVTTALGFTPFQNPMTANGDMIQGGAIPAGTPTRLTIGTPGQFLVVGGLGNFLWHTLALSDITTALGFTPANAALASTQQTGASYAFVLGDAGTVVEGNSASAQTFTIPTNASVAFPVNTIIEVFQLGAGQITIAAAGGVTLLSDGAKVKTAAQYSSIGLRQRATDVWVLTGDLA